MVDLNKAIMTTVKTGKVLFGASDTLKTAKAGKAKLIVMAANCPKDVREDIEYYSKLSNIPIIIYNGTSIDLGVACGKPFICLLYTSPSPRDRQKSRMPSSA